MDAADMKDRRRLQLWRKIVAYTLGVVLLLAWLYYTDKW